MTFDAKLTSKGQITIPARLRALLGVGTGDRVAFDVAGDGTVTVRKSSVSLDEIRGIVPYGGPPLTDDDLVGLVDEARGARAAETLDR